MSRASGKDGVRIPRRGLLLVLSSPSGAGKTTLARRLLEADSGIRMSVSVTTRKARRGEVDGVDYIFVDKAEFERLQRRRKLLEWAEVFGQYYGTPKAPVIEALKSGHDVLFDIDWQGARQLKKRLPRDVVRVFILPPDGKTLERRLKGRNQDIGGRRGAAHGCGRSGDRALERVRLRHRQRRRRPQCASLRCILTAERLKRERQSGLGAFVADVLVAL